jgi:hypothetical protein
MNAMKVAVHDTRLGKNAVPIDNDFAHATESGSSHHDVIADDYPRVSGVCPWSGLRANDHIVPKDYLTGTPNIERAKHTEV